LAQLVRDSVIVDQAHSERFFIEVRGPFVPHFEDHIVGRLVLFHTRFWNLRQFTPGSDPEKHSIHLLQPFENTVFDLRNIQQGP